MSTIEINRAADDALTFNDVMEQEFGAGLSLRPSTLLTEHDTVATELRGTFVKQNTFDRKPGQSGQTADYVAIPAALNLTALKPGLGYGLLTANGVAPAIISPRSTPQALHVLYLRGETIPPQDVGRLGYEPSQLQCSILQGVNPFQDRSVGGEAADTQASTASEGGHSMLGLKSLTDAGTKAAVLSGQHIVHSLAETPKGIMPAFVQPGSNGHGMLSTADRAITPDEMVVTATDHVF